MADYKNLAVSVGTHRQIERLAEKFGLTQKDLVAAMAQYFTVTKTDPRDSKADSPDVALKKMAEKVDGLDKRLIGFIREQEKELLRPILSEIRATRSELRTLPATPPPKAQPTPASITAADLEQLSEQIQAMLYLMFGTALEPDHLNESYINEFNRRAASR
jgi:hypothetical protein